MITLEAFMDILSLHRQGLSLRAISRRLGIHRDTVTKHIESGSPPTYRKQKRKDSILAPYYQLIEDWLAEDNYRGTWIFKKIKQLGYTGSYDTLKPYVSKIKDRQRRQAYLRFETVPGLQAQMDWADFQVAEPLGKVLTLYLFVMVLGFSRAMYAELLTSCTLQAFMDAHIRAFHYLGGVPLEVLYDNMKHVVNRRRRDGAEFNLEFTHFSNHYLFKPIACAPYSPWVKGKVERPVDYIREDFWRGYNYRGLGQANRDLLQWLAETANCRVHGTHRQRVDERWGQDVACMTKCPSKDYDTSLKVFRKVYRDCLVSYNASRYQLPPDVVGKKVLLKVKDGLIRFFDDDRLLVTYNASPQKGSCSTSPFFSEQILALREESRRGRPYGRNKGKATRGLVNASLFPQVMYRPLSVYEQIAQGGGQWNN